VKFVPTGFRPTGHTDARAAADRSADWWKTSLRLPRDHYVRMDTCDYSVHPQAVGRRVEVAADLDQGVSQSPGRRMRRPVRRAFHHFTGGRNRPCRCATGQPSSTDPAR
jgi:hypothetical protein